ncbi:Serine 3-dehydrogenase [bacterium HR11]|nr:Serine 3-dehydrogenase [bacterium HR11]
MAAQWALITGANSGIGEAFARALAARGWSLLLTARDEGRLADLAGALTRTYPGQTFAYVSADLADPTASRRLTEWAARTAGFVEFLVNNAGFGSFGPFYELPTDREVEMVRVNVEALTELTHRFLPPMIERGRGTVLLVGSVAGFQPVPYMATYAATKTYVERLGLALWYELRRRGVRVYVLAPGYTATRFHERARMSRRPPFRTPVATPESVVAECLRQIERRPDRCLIVPGWTNRLMYRLVRWVPLSLVVRTAGAMYRPR